MMKLIVYSTFCFMAYEIFKLIFLPYFWKFSTNLRKHAILAILDFLYFVYMITLFFTKYWYIGLLILIVSLITAFQLSDDFIEKSKYDKTIKSYLTVDGIVSLSLLFVIIFKQLLLKQ